MRYEQYETLPPYEVSDSLAPRIKELDLAENLADMERDGYTVLRDVASPEVTTGIREAIIRLSEETTGRAKGRSAAMLLGDEFLEANPPEMATLLGRSDFFSTTTPTSGGVDFREFARTAAISKR